MTKLFDEVFKMKNLLRRGWVLREIPNRTESDAEHCYSMIMLALEIMSKNDLKLDQLKVVAYPTFFQDYLPYFLKFH